MGRDKREGRRRDRSRSRDRERRRRDRSRDRSRDRKSRDKSREGSAGRRRRERSPSGSRRSRKGGEAEPGGSARSPSVDPEVARQQSEIDDLTKDQRTVFVSQVVMKATERQIRAFFEKIGKVKDVIMIRDKYTNRHKGFAYVEMQELDSVPMVLMLNGTVPDFQRFPILVKASEAEKNFLAKQEATAAQIEAASIQSQLAVPASRRKLVVGNVHPQISEADLRTVLTPFGDLEVVQMHAEPGAAVGKAFVTFAREEDALAASTRIAGIELGAERLTVAFADAGPSAAASSSSSSNGAGTGGGGDMDRILADPTASDPATRAALMAQLNKRAGIEDILARPPAAVTPNAPPAPAPLQGPPTTAFVISNMFDPATETEPNWRKDIHDDVSPHPPCVFLPFPCRRRRRRRRLARK